VKFPIYEIKTYIQGSEDEQRGQKTIVLKNGVPNEKGVFAVSEFIGELTA